MSSHDWHVQPVVKDPYDPPPERCRLDRGPDRSQSVLELVRNVFRVYLRLPVRSFLAPFPVYPNVRLSVNPFVFTLISSRSSSLIAVATRKSKTIRRPTNRCLENRCCANFERSTSIRPSQFWLARPRRIVFLGSCNGDVLCGIPYRGRGALASPHPTNRLLCSRQYS